ncbi:MAG TPA: hypothetical protein DDW51_12880 [Cyanobacteria bacterium UBA11367]|nr:hypothetical protein [Cyanobacteria bacterium UBA11367]HBS69628.1 hypothetical protein [Cyanobacteria bacterium UBA11153]
MTSTPQNQPMEGKFMLTYNSQNLNPGGNYPAGVGLFHRGCGRKTRPKPWAIAKIGIVQGNRIAHRFANRQDADDTLRFLQRYSPIGNLFVVIFDPEVNEQEI